MADDRTDYIGGDPEDDLAPAPAPDNEPIQRRPAEIITAQGLFWDKTKVDFDIECEVCRDPVKTQILECRYNVPGEAETSGPNSLLICIDCLLTAVRQYQERRHEEG